MRLHRTWEFLREEGKMGRRFGGSLWVLSAQEKEATMDAIEVALKWGLHWLAWIGDDGKGKLLLGWLQWRSSSATADRSRARSRHQQRRRKEYRGRDTTEARRESFALITWFFFFFPPCPRWRGIGWVPSPSTSTYVPYWQWIWTIRKVGVDLDASQKVTMYGEFSP